MREKGPGPVTVQSMSLAHRCIVFFLRQLARVFFHRVEVTGIENVPETGGGLVISWHPNGLVDPGLILTHFPRPIVFGARHGLFKWPLLGLLMRRIGTVPIIRREDVEEGINDADRRAANERSLDALAAIVARGSFASLFPEGSSHDEPYPLELRTGAARIYYRAGDLGTHGTPAPVVIPVGLHYDKKSIFGSNALVAFHPPVEIRSDLAAPLPADTPPEARRSRYKKFMAELERVLRDVVHATESWDVHHLMHRARKLIRAERAHRAGAVLGRPGMAERVLGFARLWVAYRVRLKTHPEETEALVERIRDYDDNLRALGIQDHELDGNPRHAFPWLAGILLLQIVLVYLLLPPILLVGYVVNLPTAVALHGFSKLASKSYKDEASVKILVGALAFPLTWLAAALLVAWGQTRLHAMYPTIPDAPVLTGVMAFLLSAVGGAVALKYQRLLMETVRSIRVRLTRVRRLETIEKLRAERRRLYDDLMRLAEGLDLPGAVAPDGRVVPRSDP